MGTVAARSSYGFCVHIHYRNGWLVTFPVHNMGHVSEYESISEERLAGQQAKTPI